MPAPALTANFAGTLLSAAQWRDAQRKHEAQVARFTDPHQQRAARGEKHPVFDFLFSYYAFRPAWLRQWHPGPGVGLEGAEARDFLRWPEYREFRGDDGAPFIAVEPQTFPAGRRNFLVWLKNFLEATSSRAPQFGCHGLHEWAMVYQQAPAAVRHADYPLRFSSEKISEIVRSLPLRCTHFDAFRFFTASARPLNRQILSRESAPETEQPGCLHAGMDLYKWAFKLAPFTPSALVFDCFELACAIREVDMRASPYDLEKLGFPPIAIETSAGRAEYERHQRDFAARAQPLRARLAAVCTELLQA